MKKKLLAGIVAVAMAVGVIPGGVTTSYAAQDTKVLSLGQKVQDTITVNSVYDDDDEDYYYKRTFSEVYSITPVTDVLSEIKTDYEAEFTDSAITIDEEESYIIGYMSTYPFDEDYEDYHEDDTDICLVDDGRQIMKLSAGQTYYFRFQTSSVYDGEKEGVFNAKITLSVSEKPIEDISSGTVTCENADWYYYYPGANSIGCFYPVLNFNGQEYNYDDDVFRVSFIDEEGNAVDVAYDEALDAGNYTLICTGNQDMGFTGHVGIPVQVLKDSINVFYDGGISFKASSLKKKSQKTWVEYSYGQPIKFTPKDKKSKKALSLKVDKTNCRLYVTVKKGTPKGTYKIKATLPAGKNYNKGTRIITVKVK